jgi:hypothetical protein
MVFKKGAIITLYSRKICFRAKNKPLPQMLDL